MPAFFTKPSIRHVNSTDDFPFYQFPTKRHVQIHATLPKRRFFGSATHYQTPYQVAAVSTKRKEKATRRHAMRHFLHQQPTTSPHCLLSSFSIPPSSSSPPSSYSLSPTLASQTSTSPSQLPFCFSNPCSPSILLLPCPQLVYVFPPLGHRSLVKLGSDSRLDSQQYIDCVDAYSTSILLETITR